MKSPVSAQQYKEQQLCFQPMHHVQHSCTKTWCSGAGIQTCGDCPSVKPDDTNWRQVVCPFATACRDSHCMCNGTTEGYFPPLPSDNDYGEGDADSADAECSAGFNGYLYPQCKPYYIQCSTGGDAKQHAAPPGTVSWNGKLVAVEDTNCNDSSASGDSNSTDDSDDGSNTSSSSQDGDNNLAQGTSAAVSIAVSTITLICACLLPVVILLRG